MKKAFWAVGAFVFATSAVVQIGYALNMWNDPHFNSALIVGGFMVALGHALEQLAE